MDFVSDAPFDGRSLCAMTLPDVFTREALAIEVDQRIAGEQVADVLDAVIEGRNALKRIRVDKMGSRSPRTRSTAGPLSTA